MSIPNTLASDLLAADTTMGAVTLRVADLDLMTAYYRDGVTLSVLTEEGDRTVLGRGNVPLVILEHAPELAHAGPRDAGLYHTAILFPSESGLAAAVYSVASRYPNTFSGSSDHSVSNAFYFTDPEGNGVELYWDRARTEWSWVHDQIQMNTHFLDPNAFLNAHLTQDALDDAHNRAASVGHVHLSVGDIPSARAFYVNQLGFETTTTLGNDALFVSAGRYHHHMAMNTWRSAGAGKRKRTLGLGLVRIDLPSTDDVGALAERLHFHDVSIWNDGRTLGFEDPWGNRLHVAAQLTADHSL